MASNVTLDSLSNYNGIKTVWSQRSQSISGNTSVLRATITQYSTAWTSYTSNTTLTLKADRQTKTVTVTPFNWSGANSRSLGYVEFTIEHASNGSKSASISHSWNLPIATQSKSGTFSFDTIARTSTFTIPSSFNVGSAFTVSITRASSSFTHEISLYDGNTGLYWSGNNVTTSGSVNVALSTLAARSPNAMSKTFTVRVDTYNGSTYIGVASKNITGNVPSMVKPTFSAVTVSENVSTVASLVGAYVQTKSRLNLAITGASGIYGSTIRSYNITGVGHNINSSSTLTGYLSVSGNQTIKGTVTDSRGQTFEKSIVVNILPYTAPTLSGLSFRRTLPDKTEAPLGDNATVRANVKVHSLIVNGVQKNSIKYHVQSAQVGYSFADKANTTSTSLTESYSDVWSGYSVDYSYNFRVRAGDVFGFGGWFAGVVPTGIVTQQWGSKTTSFGKMIDDTSYNVQVGTGGIQSEGNLELRNILSNETQIRMFAGSKENRMFWRESDGHFGFYLYGDDGMMNTRLRYNGKDWALEGGAGLLIHGASVVPTSGSNANGNWTKFPDGTMICRQTFPESPTTYNKENLSPSGYMVSTTWTFPLPFINSDVQVIVSGDNAGFGLDSTGQWGTKYNNVAIALMSTIAISTVRLSAVAFGRWK